VATPRRLNVLTDRVAAEAAIDFDPTTPEQRENPFDVLALARREQPVFYAATLDLWVVTRHDDVLAVLKDHRTFSSAGALKSSSAALPSEVLAVLADGCPGMPYIIELDPPLHDRIRGLVARAFTPRRIDELAPRVEAIASELIDELAPRGHADIVEAFAWPLPLRVLGELFGFPRADLEQIHRWGLDWLLLQQERPLEEQLRHAAGLVELQRYCVAVVEDRRANPTDDLLGAMVAANDGADEPLSAVEIAGLPLDLMVAGHVTVTRAIGSALHRVFAESMLREHLLDPELCPRAIEEILRLESPAQGLFRVTTRQVELGGAVLPPGARVMAHFASANRDACVFADPDRYRPEREDLGAHLAFGKGIHFCIGAPLGRLELRVALPMLLRRLPGLRPGTGIPAREAVFFARGFTSLDVEWDP
jgi:cytochrome P450